MKFTQKDNYKFYDLVKIIELLRAPDGCPWDKVQTHQSIRQDFIEETYEVIEAIDNDDRALLKEELGDVLLQVVFHAQIETEQDSFTINDVADGVCKKMIIRHPHVFGNVQADTVDEVLTNWDNIKMQTKSQTTQSEVLAGISKALPSLMRSQKLQKKAGKIGFDWQDIHGAMDKLKEEVSELDEAVTQNDLSHIEEELGDVLFSAVNIARFAHTDAEKVLYNACEKFIQRFTAMEQLAKQQDIDIQKTDLEMLNTLWENIKNNQ